MTKNKIKLGITTGDPLGIGPEVSLKALQLLTDDAVECVFFHQGEIYDAVSLQKLSLLAVPNLSPEQAGQLSVANLNLAMAAWRKGEIDAIVTAPIHKYHVSMAGFPFPGHTEFLADACNSKNYLMMLASTQLKVTLVTIHEPIAAVPSLLKVDKIINTIQITHQALQQDFGIVQPKLAVCGLNPHAGEQGKFGQEEIKIIRPAIEQCQQMGINCEGPMVPDAIFHEYHDASYDAVVCMYHDQGLIPFKMLHFHDGVNVTLGLPLVRTSPDHGTALDIAGGNRANAQSMLAAMQVAKEIVINRRKL